jgi:hypothetical protein
MARKRNPLVFLDVSIGDEQDERMVFEVFFLTAISLVYSRGPVAAEGLLVSRVVYVSLLSRLKMVLIS